MNVYTDLEVGKKYAYTSELESAVIEVLAVHANDHVEVKLDDGTPSFLTSMDNDCRFTAI